MQALKPYLLPLIAAVVLAVLFVVRPNTDPAQPVDTGADKKAAGQVSPATAPKPSADRQPRESTDSATPRAATDTPTEVATPTPPRDSSKVPSAERDQRDAMRARIAKAIASGAPDAKAAAEAPKLDKDYIRQRIKDDLIPIAQECYESALVDKPKTGGKLTMQFTIVGAPDVGGIVDEVSLDQDTTLSHPELIECMTESMMSVTFEPPPDGGTVTVTYPFIFEPGPPK